MAETNETQTEPLPTVLADGSEFVTEREFFCANCSDFSDARQNAGDIVCFECAWVIATYRDRPVLAAGVPTAPTA